jgi:bacillithiol biosynthesis cysteine-adding enzyme BshC
VITAQYDKLGISPPDSLALLADKNTYTVTTGHQLCLATGPLYFVYKIITTILLAKKLKKQFPYCHFIPVFWLASEDHDFSEINHFHLFGKKYSWYPPYTSGAVGRLSTEGISEILADITDIPDFFRQAYQQNTSLSAATMHLVQTLFGKTDLLQIDADDSRLKAQFQDVITEELLNQPTEKLITATNTELQNLGYKPQIHPRNINLFYLDENLRERIEKKQDGSYKVLNTDLSFDNQQIKALIAKNPEKFSPNVALRPLYQETILPNIAYIGGPGEIVYWCQLKAVFTHFQTEFPLLVPRNFATLVTPTLQKKIDKLQLSDSDIFLPEITLKQSFVKKNATVEVNLSDKIAQINQVFEQIAATASLTDITLKSFVLAEASKVVKSVEAIQKKIEKSEEKKMETSLHQLIAMREKIFPEGILQERHENILNYLINYPTLIEELQQVFEPLNFKMYKVNL